MKLFYRRIGVLVGDISSEATPPALLTPPVPLAWLGRWVVVRGRYRKGLRLIILILFNPVRSIYPSRTYNLSQESLNGGDD
jgi:hypothetical protein